MLLTCHDIQLNTFDASNVLYNLMRGTLVRTEPVVNNDAPVILKATIVVLTAEMDPGDAA